MPHSILTIAGVDYDHVDRPAARVRMDGVELLLEGGHDSCSFTEVCGHPVPTWHNGQTVTLTWVSDDLSSRVIFSGRIEELSHAQAETGWLISYQATANTLRAADIPVTGYDRTGVLVFNRSPEDPAYTTSEAGLEVGEILRFLLTVEATATALDAEGIGNYITLSPPTLHADTDADLNLLTIVPPQPVTLTDSVLDAAEQLLQHWMPKWCMKVFADGTIRFRDTTDTTTAFTPFEVVLPNATVASDPVEWPSMRKSTSRCATRVLIRGAAEVEATILSLEDGTLQEEWSPTEEADWTMADFTEPKDAYDSGTIVSMTGNSAVVNPTDPARAWSSNFWSGRKAWIYMYNNAVSGLQIHQARVVTTNTACTAGGTATITWDSAWPVDNPDYTTYRLMGASGGATEVGRLFSVREPDTGDTGLDTYVGSHLVRRSPLPIWVAHNSIRQQVFYPFGYVCWSKSGDPPYREFPVFLEAVPTEGKFRFTQPVAVPFTLAEDLAEGYPATFAKGKPADVRIIAMYSRGTLEAVAPANTGAGLDVPAYEGRAHTVDGLEVTKVIDLPTWTHRGDYTRLAELAQQHLDALKDTVHEGSFEWKGLPPWDWWEMGTAINFSVPPLTGLWEDINAPIRSIRISWPTGEGLFHKASIGFSNRRRPHSGDDLYLPAAFTYEQEIDFTRIFDQSDTVIGTPEGSMSVMGGDGKSMLPDAWQGRPQQDEDGNTKYGSLDLPDNFSSPQGLPMGSPANPFAQQSMDQAMGGAGNMVNNAFGNAQGAVDATMNNAQGAVNSGLGAASDAVGNSMMNAQDAVNQTLQGASDAVDASMTPRPRGRRDTGPKPIVGDPLADAARAAGFDPGE